MSNSRARRRAVYTRASDVAVRDATTGEPLGILPRYSASELVTVRNGRTRKASQIAKKKTARLPNRAVDLYLHIINADN